MNCPTGLTRLVAGLVLVVAMLPIAAQAGTLHLTITSIADAGPGSLRDALEQAAAHPERPVRIDFGDSDGPFNSPQVIELAKPLPAIAGDVHIDGFIRGLLWTAYGATISGGDRHRLFDVLPGARLSLTGVTLGYGRAETGAAILNAGALILEGVTLLENHAAVQGGALANLGEAYLVNSTLAWNQASEGGALANTGKLGVVNVTLFQNQAQAGAAVWSRGDLHLANSILAGQAEDQCHSTGSLSAESSHNLIQGAHLGCGVPILTEDPMLDQPGYFNGPTLTFPIGTGSPVVNLGLNEAAVDADGKRLTWDQRGNGDPRFASGFTDLGAFERQGQLPTRFVVDMVGDNGLRACHAGGARRSCPLRAALELAAAARHDTPIHFEQAIFSEPRELVLKQVPPGTDKPLLIDGTGVAPLTIVVPQAVPWQAYNGVSLRIDPSISARSQP